MADDFVRLGPRLPGEKDDSPRLQRAIDDAHGRRIVWEDNRLKLAAPVQVRPDTRIGK